MLYYEKARNSNHRPIYKDGSPIRNLGFTFHAGDRIGHGIALGISIKSWIKNNSVVTLTRIEYLENLLWIWGLYKDKKSLTGFDISYIERKILEQAEKIYDKMEGITVFNLYESYKKKFQLFKNNEYEKEYAKDNYLFCAYVKK